MKRVLLLFLILSPILLAQQKFLVTPNQEYIPLMKDERIPDIIAKHSGIPVSSRSRECGSKYIFGITPELFPRNGSRYAYHKDVMGQWYDAKASGTIDTVFWFGSNSNGAKDSLVYLRIHESNIGPNFGPGRGIYVNALPCQNWGYWLNSLDFDQGVAAFPDDATDTTWYSTINTQGGTIPPTRPPFGFSKWGALGFSKHHKPGINAVAMMDAGEPCSVKVGENFFISLRVNSGPYHPVPLDPPTYFWGWSSQKNLTTDDEYWPARNWKFYEHDSNASNCAGTPIHLVKRGWVARGPMRDSVLWTDLLSIWYSMTVTSNVPPLIKSIEGGDPTSTFSNNDYTVQYEVYDCDPSDPDGATISSAVLKWSRGQITSQGAMLIDQPDITMYPIGGDLWEAVIPGQAGSTIISYHVAATDNKGMTQLGPTQSFRVIKWNQDYYRIDTNTCSHHYTIKGLPSTQQIPYTAFFSPPDGGQVPRDDGTAGPYDLGGAMPIFADVARYVWIGINGAIALSKSAEDTIDINSGGYWTNAWSFPYKQHHSRWDTINGPTTMPPNFIAPFFADFIIADTGEVPTTYGHIFYGNGGETCKFIVEWDSIGSYNYDLQQGETDATIFRIVLNKCDGTIEYQYLNVGTHGQDSSCLVGMQADSSEISGPEPGYVMLNHNIYPIETKPRVNFCIKFYPGVALFAQAGWNLLSVANDRPGDMAKISVYPDAISDAFAYEGSYVQKPTLVNGVGYWLKYDKYTYAGAPGYVKNAVTANVATGWNMIGSITKAVPTSGIVKTPSGMTVSDYFKYEGGYQTVTTLTPGLGFWVKTDQAGTLDLAAPESMPKEVAVDYTQMNRITVTDRLGRQQKLYVGEESVMKAQSIYTGEMPPAAPEFDARFATTGSMAVTYPASLEGRLEYPISVTTDAYPITVKWEVVKPMVMYAGGKMVGAMEGTGMVQLKSAAGLAIGIGSGVSVPKVFALGQNYPNPFNPVTHFSYDVPKLADVQIAVYNVLGQKVKTLLSQETSPGSYEMEWDGTDGQGVSVPTGIYFMRMSSDDFKATKKVILMK